MSIALKEKEKNIAQSIRGAFCAYTGPSMYPTLAESDLLEVEPYGPCAPRLGDVILFHPPEQDRMIVHRIVSLTPRGLQTRGDNNCLTDPWILDRSDIVGNVIAAWRGQTRRMIPSGRTGHMIGRLRYLQRIVKHQILNLLCRPIYQFLIGSYDARQHQWRIRYPFPFFMNTPILPKSDTTPNA